jgi:hypothetical protein
MIRLEGFHPPACCSTAVCGLEAFAVNQIVKAALALVNGAMVSRGSDPPREQLVQMAGLA